MVWACFSLCSSNSTTQPAEAFPGKALGWRRRAPLPGLVPAAVSATQPAAAAADSLPAAAAAAAGAAPAAAFFAGTGSPAATDAPENAAGDRRVKRQRTAEEASYSIGKPYELTALKPHPAPLGY